MKKGISTVLTVCLTAVVALALAAGGYYYFDKQNKDEKASLQAQINDLNTELATAKKAATIATTSTSTTDWNTYTNAKYKFTLTLADKWLGYKVYDWNQENTESPAPATDLYKLCVPTTSTSWTDSIKGYACPISILVYPKATYDSLTDSSQPDSDAYASNKLSEKDSYVFVAQYWQDSPDDLRANSLDQTVTAVAHSFKFAN